MNIKSIINKFVSQRVIEKEPEILHNLNESSENDYLQNQIRVENEQKAIAINEIKNTKGFKIILDLLSQRLENNIEKLTQVYVHQLDRATGHIEEIKEIINDINNIINYKYEKIENYQDTLLDEIKKAYAEDESNEK